MAEAVTLYSLDDAGQSVYIAPDPLSTETGSARIAVLVLTAITVLAPAVLVLVAIDGAIAMA